MKRCPSHFRLINGSHYGIDSFVMTRIDLCNGGGVHITLNSINWLIGGGVITKLLFGMSHVPGG